MLALRLPAAHRRRTAAQQPARCAAAPRPERDGGASASSASAPFDELVFVLERRGEGWAEEIFPHVTVQRRAAAVPRVEEVSSVQLLLRQAGLSDAAVTEVVARATAWRATTGGRQLLDRKKQRAVQRNAAAVLSALREPAGSAAGGGARLQSVLLRWPHLLELDAAQEWEQRYCALALRLQAAGGDGAAASDAHQAAWEEEQREAARLGMLPPARGALLDAVGFDWGLVDRDWEEHFDELVAFTLAVGHADVLGGAVLGDAPPGPLLEWASRQRALHRLGTLPPAAEARLRAVGFPLPAVAQATPPAAAPPAGAAPAKRTPELQMATPAFASPERRAGRGPRRKPA